jgi:hypothetical protein
VAANRTIGHSEKEKAHATSMDNNYRSGYSVAARCFRWEIKFKLPEDRQLDPYSDRYRHHTHHIALARSVVILSRSQPAHPLLPLVVSQARTVVLYGFSAIINHFSMLKFTSSMLAWIVGKT